MTNESASPGRPAAVDRATFQAELDKLRAREKAHTREGDAIAAARRRLPMVEVDASLTLTGPHGPVTLLDAFEGRRQLIAYYFMWWDGHPAAEQCEGCTFYTTQVGELSYLHSRDITYAVFCQGRYAETARYRDFMGWDVPWYSARDSLDALLIGRLGSDEIAGRGTRRPVGAGGPEAEAAVLHHADALGAAGHGAVASDQHHGQAALPPHGLEQAGDPASSWYPGVTRGPPGSSRAASSSWPARPKARTRSAPCSWRTGGPCPARRNPSQWSR
jgi:hypothetical protein